MTTGTRYLSREETEAKLRDLNAQAKDMSRQGKRATQTAEYAALHMRINGLVDDLLAARG